jgi:Cu/Ag efflux protein CusF
MKLSVLCVSVLLLALAIPAAIAQQGAAPPDPQGQNTPAQQDQEVRSFEGSLTKVDAEAKTITLKSDSNAEMTFSYNDQTQVVGADDGVQGLTGKTGSSMKVSYRVQKGSNYASKIEIQPKKAL